jgi:CBS domain-containing protein
MKTAQDIAAPSAPFGNAMVQDVMTTGVVACTGRTPLAAVARMMCQHRVHAVVVLTRSEEGERSPWGVVSDLDLVKALSRACPDDPAALAAETPAVMIRFDAPLERAAELMARNETTHLIVVGPDLLHPLGVISALDLARSLAARQAWAEAD